MKNILTKIISSITFVDFVWLLTRLLIFFGPPYISDVSYYQELCQQWNSGLLPYTSHSSFEYPPLAVIPIILPGFMMGFFTNPEIGYRFGFHLLALSADLWIYLKLRKKLNPVELFLLSLTTLSLGRIIYDRIDVFVAAFLILTLTMKSARNVWAKGLMLGTGFMFKFVPIIPFPIYFKELAAMKDRLQLTLGAAIAPSVTAALFLLGQLGYPAFLSQHMARGIQIESFWASLVFWSEKSHCVGIVSNYGAQHLESICSAFDIHSWELFAKFGLIFYVLFTVVVILRMNPDRVRFNRHWLTFWSVLGFVVFNRVLSTQFWVFVLMTGFLALTDFSLDRGRYVKVLRYILPGTLLTLGVMSGYVFEYYWNLVQLQRDMVELTMVRNFLAFALWLVFAVVACREAFFETTPEVSKASPTGRDKSNKKRRMSRNNS